MRIHGRTIVFITSIRMGLSAKDRGSQHGLVHDSTSLEKPACMMGFFSFRFSEALPYAAQRRRIDLQTPVIRGIRT